MFRKLQIHVEALAIVSRINVVNGNEVGLVKTDLREEIRVSADGAGEGGWTGGGGEG
jgi:hypothetical protein